LLKKTVLLKFIKMDL